MFRTGRVRNPVTLAAGKHRLFAFVKYKGAAHLRVEIEAAREGPGSVKVFPPNCVPDLVALGAGIEDPDAPASGYGLGASSALSLPVLNTGDELVEVRFSVITDGSEAGGRLSVEPLSKSSGFVAPGQLTSIGMRVQLSSPLSEKKKKETTTTTTTTTTATTTVCPLRLRLEAQARTVAKPGGKNREWEQVGSAIPVTLRCRTTRQSFVFTFVDHDGTVSRAAAIAPLPGKSGSGGAGVLLSHHGTGVDLKMQADSYKHKSKGSTDSEPYIFGVVGAWVLAPTRHGAHNWEYTGFLSAVTALERLGDLSALPKHVAAAARTGDTSFALPDAKARVLFTGHSMGGHGAYVSATHLPGRGVAAAPAAGWFRKENYGDSNTFFSMHDIGTAHAEPALKAVLEACVVEYAADLVASNLAAFPGGVRLRVGSEDRAVPPWQVKRFFRLLREHDVEGAEYEEVPGQAHWWWDTLYSNDGGALNDEAMREFYQRAFDSEGGRNTTSSFSYVVFNPSSFEWQRGCRVLQQTVSLKRSRIDFAAGGGALRWRLKTSNVRRLGIDVGAFCDGGGRNSGVSCAVEVDGGSRLVLGEAGVVELCQGSTHDGDGDGDGGGDGDEIAIDASGRQQVVPDKRKKQWHLCSLQTGLEAHIPLGSSSSSSYAFEEHERGPSNSGPARTVFASPFLTVAGTKADDDDDDDDDNNDETTAQLLKAALYIGNTHFTSTDSRTAVLPDWAVSTEVRSER